MQAQRVAPEHLVAEGVLAKDPASALDLLERVVQLGLFEGRGGLRRRAFGALNRQGSQGTQQDGEGATHLIEEDESGGAEVPARQRATTAVRGVRGPSRRSDRSARAETRSCTCGSPGNAAPSSARNNRRARCARVFTVATGMSRYVAVSWSDRPSTSRSMNTARKGSRQGQDCALEGGCGLPRARRRVPDSRTCLRRHAFDG